MVALKQEVLQEDDILQALDMMIWYYMEFRDDKIPKGSTENEDVAWAKSIVKAQKNKT